jgi:hypothetical protein
VFQNFPYLMKQKIPQTDEVPKVIVMERDQQSQHEDYMEQGQNELLTNGIPSYPLQTQTTANAASSNPLVVPSNDRTKLLVPTPQPSNLIAGDKRMKVKFTDPMSSGCADVQVSPTKTASECIQALKDNGFLGQGSYHLIVNGKTMLPDQILRDSGIAEGGTVVTQKMEEGA